jgi:2-C-methyl-D-erythritol 4-phosphate cytidylyltransferase / 2-C-methyl-D-erythritol 2,4-cyclodiphosphate synthase
MRVAVLIVAAGRGTRAGEGLPKQYRTVGGFPLLSWTLAAFSRHPDIAFVQPIIHPDDVTLYEEASAGCAKLCTPVFGGETRQASVLAGLEAIEDIAPTHVLIHDGARAFVDAKLTDRVLAALAKHEGALPCLPVTDTLRNDLNGQAGETVDRAGLVRAQTPQGFSYLPILDAHRNAKRDDFTDDVALASVAGISTTLVAGAEENFKVTEPHDFARAEQQLGVANEVRTGSGYDVHRFCDGDHVTLCGVDIPHSHGLLGHSDADVAMHAVTDALLGAIGAGDIGDHFPPSDPQWKGAPSKTFLLHAAELLKSKLGRINNVDLTIICENPKIGPHREQLRGKLSELLKVSVDRISVKATTTEGLGFTGREEGITAQSIVTISIPNRHKTP